MSQTPLERCLAAAGYPPPRSGFVMTKAEPESQLVAWGQSSRRAGLEIQVFATREKSVARRLARDYRVPRDGSYAHAVGPRYYEVVDETTRGSMRPRTLPSTDRLRIDRCLS